MWKDESDLSNEQSEPNAVTELPTRSELMERVTSFKESLKLTTQQIQELELRTREQHRSELWFSARRYRLTASIFGAILRLRPSTPPDSLVKQLLHQKEFSTQATIWGKENEDIALETYMEYKKKCGNNDLITCNAGFVVCEKHPFLGASPDAYVFDPSGTDPYGLIEIKCPFKYCDLYPEEASRQTDFFCTLSMKDGRQIVELKHNHPYFAQIQGQLAITERSWCDFVVYT